MAGRPSRKACISASRTGALSTIGEWPAPAISTATAPSIPASRSRTCSGVRPASRLAADDERARRDRPETRPQVEREQALERVDHERAVRIADRGDERRHPLRRRIARQQPPHERRRAAAAGVGREPGVDLGAVVGPDAAGRRAGADQDQLRDALRRFDRDDLRDDAAGRVAGERAAVDALGVEQREHRRRQALRPLEAAPVAVARRVEVGHDHAAPAQPGGDVVPEGGATEPGVQQQQRRVAVAAAADRVAQRRRADGDRSLVCRHARELRGRLKYLPRTSAGGGSARTRRPRSPQGNRRWGSLRPRFA